MFAIVFYEQDADEYSDEITGVKLVVAPFESEKAAKEAGRRLWIEHGEYDIAPLVKS